MASDTTTNTSNSTNSNDSAVLDLIIIGGGPAGMSAALTAGRALLETVIVNAESPRNAAATASHGFLARDGAHPTEFLAVAPYCHRPYRRSRPARPGRHRKGVRQQCLPLYVLRRVRRQRRTPSPVRA